MSSQLNALYKPRINEGKLREIIAIYTDETFQNPLNHLNEQQIIELAHVIAQKVEEIAEQ